MSGALMNKVWDLFGMDTQEEEDVYEEENEYDEEVIEENNRVPIWRKKE